MPSYDSEVTQLQYSLVAITMAALVKAQQSTGAVGGSDLAPYLNSTVRREPSGAFVVTRPDGIFRAASAEEAVPILGEGFLKELASSSSNPDHTFMQRRVDFINGPAFQAAEAFLKSVDPSYC
jgi:hypothetical protein